MKNILVLLLRLGVATLLIGISGWLAYHGYTLVFADQPIAPITNEMSHDINVQGQVAGVAVIGTILFMSALGCLLLALSILLGKSEPKGTVHDAIHNVVLFADMED